MCPIISSNKVLDSILYLIIFIRKIGVNFINFFDHIPYKIELKYYGFPL